MRTLNAQELNTVSAGYIACDAYGCYEVYDYYPVYMDPVDEAVAIICTVALLSLWIVALS